MSMDLQRFADTAQERTEAATQRRKDEARRRGQVVKSMEVVSAVTLLTTWVTLQTGGSLMVRQLSLFTQESYALIAHPDFSEGAVGDLLRRLMLVTVIIAFPVVLAALVSGLLANYLQVGFVFTFEGVSPKFSRINPGEGFKRIFSRRSLMEFVKGLLKLTIVGFVAYNAIMGDLPHFAGLLDQPATATATILMQVMDKLVLRVGLSLLGVGLADYLYQRFEFNQSLKMTKQEVREEMKETEGDPLVKSAIRRRQREMARHRMMEDVKKADVVVTNPTHFAIAIRYKASEGAAPRVVAKGQGLLAQRIKEIAREADIPLVENKPLAQALYKAVDLGKPIPQELYQAVAEVLAVVYRLKGRAM